MSSPRATVETADVVVVGGGGSGLAAAVAAAQRGVRVRLIEKRETLGGTTALSVGSFCAAGTRHQRRRGIRDAPDAYLDDMAAFTGELTAREPPAPRAMLVAEAAQTLHW